MDLNKYKKIPAKVSGERRVKPRSVNLTKEQRIFLEKNNLNLSELVRDFLDQLMKEAG